MEELKACPFCGNANVQISPYDGGKTAICMDCLCRTPTYSGDDALEKSITAWNRRSAPENKPLTLEELREMDESPIWVAELEQWAIATVDEYGKFSNMPFAQGKNFDYDIAARNLTCYARKPEQGEPK